MAMPRRPGHPPWPSASGRILLQARLAAMPRPLFGHGCRIAVEKDPALPGQRDEALSLRPAHQSEIGPTRQLDAPGGEAGARDQDGNAHLHAFDHHLAGKPAGGVEDLSLRPDLVEM